MTGVQPKRLNCWECEGHPCAHELGLDELPPFTPGTIKWVQWSIGRLPHSNERILTDTFYEELFVLAPEARALFAEDISPQSDRLLHALLNAAKHMDNPVQVDRHLRTWGIIHRRQYGVTDEMYVYVGQALVRTINKLLGNDQTIVHSSWVAVYQWMAAVMISAADAADNLRREPGLLDEDLLQPINVHYYRGKEADTDNVVTHLSHYRARRDEESG